MNQTISSDEQLQRLAAMRDEDIDTSDIPETTDWSRATVGGIYRPLKQPVTLRIDRDVVLWLKASGSGYQSRINLLLRDEMQRQTIKRDTDLSVEMRPSTTPTFKFRELERLGILDERDELAEVIASRGSIFPMGVGA